MPRAVRVQFRPGRMSRSKGAALAAMFALCVASLLVPSPADAHSDPTIFVRLKSVNPKLPSSVKLTLLDGDNTFLLLTNASTTPVYVLDPNGTPYLAVSSAGVVGDRDSAYLGPAAQATGTTPVQAPACCKSGRWVRLTTKDGFLWSDPRLYPTQLIAGLSGGNRGLGSLVANAPLATWHIGLQYGRTTYTANGEVDRMPAGYLTTVVKSVPPGFHVSVIDGHQPQMRMQAPLGSIVEVLGGNGAPFIRVTSRGAWGLLQSPEYRYHRMAIGLEPPPGRGWTPMEVSGPDRVTWADYRLNHGDNVPAGDAPGVINQWRIPLRVNGKAAQISGVDTWMPTVVTTSQLDPSAPVTKWLSGKAGYEVAAGFTALLFVALFVAWRRREISDDDEPTAKDE